jgi:AraC-like DNA-binding protein
MQSRLDRITDWSSRLARTGFRVSTLAQDCNICERELRAYIRVKFGLTPHRWMLKLRMQQARALLSGDHSLKEIAQQLGDKNQAHFSRQFRTVYRTSPSELRHRRV